MIVQKASGTDDLSTSRQALFLELTKSDALGVAAADSMVVMTYVGGGKTASVSYMLGDRK